jgi:P-type Cu+ transporter
MTIAQDSAADACGSSLAGRRLAREQRATERRAAQRRNLVLVIGCAALAAPMVLPLFGYLFGIPLHLHAWIEFVLATPVQFIFAAPIYARAWRALRSLSGNMELLLALGSLAAYGLSTDAVLRQGVAATGHVYFEQSSTAITLTMLGYWLEPPIRPGNGPSGRLVDQVAGLYAAAAVALALGTLLAWRAGGGPQPAWIAALSVLVMACPCALGLAVPAALAAARSTAARAGLSIHDTDAFERAAGVDTVVFDKPGTLSEGRLAVVAIELAPAVDEARLLRFAAAIQVVGEDPVARAILAAVPSGVRLPRVGGVRIDPGRGVAATVEGRAVVLGNRDMMRQAGIDLGRLEVALNRLERASKTVVVVAVDGRALGVLAVADPLRENAAAAIRMLTKRNIHSEMLTGDSEAIAGGVAVELEVTGYQAMIEPAAAPSAVRALTAEGHRVAVAGDGSTDPPVLAAAEVGLAFGGGGSSTAGVTLMRADPRLVPAMLDLAGSTVAAVRFNLLTALLTNAVGVPLAALGYLTPALAAAAMGLSMLSVAASSLWLRTWRPKFGRRVGGK